MPSAAEEDDASVTKQKLGILFSRRGSVDKIAPSLPSWRREEAWRGANASALFDIGHTFTYILETGSHRLQFVEDHDAIGHRVWDGAMIICKWFERCAQDGTLFGERIVELGSGTGIAGLVASKLTGGSHSILTDVPAIVPRIEQNIQAHDWIQRAQAMPLMWGNEEHLARVIERLGGLPDTVIASDMAAPVKHVEDFMQTLKGLMPPERTSDTPSARLLLLVQHHRDFTPPLLEACRVLYHVVEVPNSELHPDYTSPRHSVYTVRPIWAAVELGLASPARAKIPTSETTA